MVKTMVGDKKAEEVIDPKMPVKPSSRALKRALLLALHCVDPDSQRRPKMGNVIHMLEMDDLLFCHVCQSISYESQYDKEATFYFYQFVYLLRLNHFVFLSFRTTNWVNNHLVHTIVTQRPNSLWTDTIKLKTVASTNVTLLRV